MQTDIHLSLHQHIIFMTYQFIYESNEININDSKKTEPDEVKQVEEGLKKINKLSSLKC